MNIHTEQLRRVMQEKGIRQGALAKAAGFMPLSYVSALLCGWQKLTPKAAQRLHAALKSLGVVEEELQQIFGCTSVQARKD